MRYVAVLFGLIAMLAFVGCGDDDPVSSISQEEINSPAGKLVMSATKAGGLRSKAELRKIAQAGTAAWNAQDMDAMQSRWTDDFVSDYVPFGLIVEGKEANADFNAGFFQSFPDIQWENQRILVSGNILVSEWIATGTHQGEFLGIAPTGIYSEVPHLTVTEYEGGKDKRSTTYVDYVTIMTNLGAMPAGELPSLEPSFALPDPEPTGLSPMQSAREMLRRFNTHDMALFMQLVHEDAEIFFNTIGVPIDRTTYAALNELYIAAFSDLTGEYTRLVDLGDGWVLGEAFWVGTHDGPYLGIPASGNEDGIVRSGSLMKFDADGLLTDFRYYYDEMTNLRNIGAVQ